MSKNNHTRTPRKFRRRAPDRDPARRDASDDQDTPAEEVPAEPTPKSDGRAAEAKAVRHMPDLNALSTMTQAPMKNRRRKLRQYEKKIDRSLKGMLVAAVALRAIRQHKLYELDYKSFEDYCLARFHFSKSYASRMIKWADLCGNFHKRGHEHGPPSLSAATPLLPLDRTAQDSIWSNILNRRADRSAFEVTRTEVIDEVKLYKEAQESLRREDGGARLGDSPIIIPGRSPLVDAYGRIAGQPLVPTKGQGLKGEPLLVSTPGTLFKTPTSLLHFARTSDLPEGAVGDKPADVKREFINAMVEESVRIGLMAEFYETNHNVGWAKYCWNPITGCWHDCVFCYARDIALRYYPQGFTPTMHPARLRAPYNTALPTESDNPWERFVFVASMGDLFSLAFGDAYIEATLKAMEDNPGWTFLVLTKHPVRLANFVFPPNVWVGTTVVNQAAASRAEKAMRDLKATVKWVSLEPLLGPVVFEDPAIFDWFVIGAQLKTWKVKALQPEGEWVLSLIEQALKYGVRVWTKTNLKFQVNQLPG